MHSLVRFLTRLRRFNPRHAVRPALFALALSLHLSPSIFAQGIKTDLGGIYPEPAAPPLPRAGGVVADPTFGTQIMRVTDESDGDSAGTAYSYWPSFNRDSTRLLAHYADGRARVYEFDAANFRLGSKHIIANPPETDGGWGYTTFEDAIWSGLDADKLFVHRGAAVFAYDARARSYEKLFDLSAQFPAGHYFFQMSRSLDDDTFAFTLRDAQYRLAGYVVYRRSAGRMLVNERVSALDEVQIDKSGRYLVVKTGEQGGGMIEVRVFDLTTGAVEELRDDGPDFAPAHSDNGTGTVVGGDNWNARWTIRRLGDPHRPETALDGRDQWDNDGHVSMLADDERWALVSFFGAAASGWLRREIVQVATDGSQRVRRLAHHHSIYRSYSDSPRANVSRDGRFVAFTSNWGGRSRTDLFILRITPASGAESATPTPTPSPSPSPSPTAAPLVSPALIAAAYDAASRMAARAENSDAEFQSLIEAVDRAYAALVAEQQRIPAGAQAEMSVRAARYFASAAKALAEPGRYPAGAQSRLQIAASRLAQASALLAPAAGSQLEGEQAHASTSVMPPAVIGSASTLSAASLAPVVSPASLATIVGDAAGSPLAAAAAAAAKLTRADLPYELAGASVTIAGRAAPLVHASQSRLSFMVPAGLPAGEAEVIVTSQDGYVSSGTVVVESVAPALFMRGDTTDAVAFNAFDTGADAFAVLSPFNLGIDKRTRLSVLATGLSSDAALNTYQPNDVRASSSLVLSNFAESVAVEARLGDGRTFSLPVDYAGALASAAGVDQVNFVLTEELRGAGRVEITLVVAGRRSNTVSVNVR